MKLPKIFPKASFKPNNITLHAERDQVGQYHFRPPSLLPAAASRFRHLQKALLSGELTFREPHAQLAACLVLFDGIATRHDLECALANASGCYIWKGRRCIEWIDAIGRVNRRILSAFSCAALAQPNGSERHVMATLKAVNSCLLNITDDPGVAYTLDILLLDTQAWLFEILSGPMLAHCLNLAPIALLSRSVLGREATGRAIIIEDKSLEKTQSEPGLAMALGAYFDSPETDGDTWLVAEIIATCRRNRTIAPAEDKKRMLRLCLAMSARASGVGKTSALILAWTIDLLESGTKGRTAIRPGTVQKYVEAAASKLLVAFRKRPIEDLSTAGLVCIYRKMMDGLSSSKSRTLASALQSWHHFLSCWLDVEPLWTSLHKWIPLSPPQANVLWPHELALISEWLKKDHCDERLLRQLQIAFSIAKSIRIRTSELMGLTLRNIWSNNTEMEIEICSSLRTPADGANGTDLKTPAARRAQKLTDLATIDLINDWICRREKEGAWSEDYIFGDPYHPSQRYRIGQLCLTLSKLLKAATGDPSVRIHTLSHTHISFKLLDAANIVPVQDINPFDTIAASSGHESASTEFSTYFHLAESVLRAQLDQGCWEQLTWGSISAHVGLEHDAYRQFRSRAKRRIPGQQNGEIALAAIERASPMLFLKDVSDGFSFTDARCPDISEKERPLTLFSTLDILADVTTGLPKDEMVLRSARNASTVDALIAEALLMLEKLSESTGNQRDWMGEQKHATLHALLSGPPGTRIKFSSAEQPKLGLLAAFLQDRPEEPVTTEGIASWRKCYRRGYLSLEDPTQAVGLIKLICAAKVPLDLLLVRIAHSPKSQADEPRSDLCGVRLQRAIERLFLANDQAVSPSWDEVAHRRGRPRAYLAVVSSSAQRFLGKELPSAMAAMGGFNALMFAANVLSALRLAV